MRPATLTGMLALLGLLAGLVVEDASATEAPLHHVINVADFRVAGDDTATIEAAIAHAEPGDTVYFPPGEYVLKRPFQFASGINYVGADGARLRAASPGGLILGHHAAAPLRHVTIRGLTFDNISISLRGTSSQNKAFVNVTFYDCVFTNGHQSPTWSEPYLSLAYTRGVTVDSCQFLRSAGHGGRGVIAYKTTFTVVKDSYFGTTPNLEPGVPNGHFRTAINVSGYDEQAGDRNRDTIIDGNVWRRTPGLSKANTCDTCEDHGLYAWGTRRLFIVGNRADGWTATATGGALKIRNQDETFVVGNSFSTSGILTYVYDSDNSPSNLSRVVIRDNTINLNRTTTCKGPYCGISFWRDFTSSEQPERHVYITGNTFTAGGSIRIVQGNGPGFCVENNTDASLSLLSKGVQLFGCDEPQDWDQPLAGLHRGDFNGDGVEDFVHYVDRSEDPGFWRAHISAGHGFQTANWGGGGYTSPATADYGVHVADFNGDGLDDLTYAGLCGDQKPCWRTHLSTGKTFARGADWGYSVYPSDATRRYGFATGDFNGDRRADLVSRAYCGRQKPCWRTHLSTGSAFRVNEARTTWHPSGATSGLLAGDYDGDGRDDVAYIGACDDTSKPCFWVHRGRDPRFRPHNWGAQVYLAQPLSSHFGVTVSDVNRDGRADVGYLGHCGTNTTVRWRHHLSTGRGFNVTCSPTRTRR